MSKTLFLTKIYAALFTNKSIGSSIDSIDFIASSKFNKSSHIVLILPDI